MKSFHLFFLFLVIFLSSFQILIAQDTLQIDRQFSDNQDIATRIIAVNNRYGITNDTGKVLMKPQFERLHFFVSDTSCSHWKGIIKAQHGGAFALVGTNGIPITPLDYDEILFMPKTCHAEHKAGRVALIKKFGKYGLVNTKGDILIRPSYDKIELLTDSEGKLTIPEVARVRRHNAFGMMELRSKKILKTEYQSIEFFQTLNQVERKKNAIITILLLRQKNKLAVRNLHNHLESPAVYDQIELYDSIAYLARVKKGRKYGFLDLTAKLKIPATYDYADSFREGISIVQRKDKFGVLNKSGKAIIPIVYSDIQFINSYPNIGYLKKALIVQKKNLYGVLDTDGKVLIPVKYEKLEFSPEKRNFEGQKNGKTEFIKL